jgi:hypothetical protein
MAEMQKDPGLARLCRIVGWVTGAIFLAWFIWWPSLAYSIGRVLGIVLLAALAGLNRYGEPMPPLPSEKLSPQYRLEYAVVRRRSILAVCSILLAVVLIFVVMGVDFLGRHLPLGRTTWALASALFLIGGWVAGLLLQRPYRRIAATLR